MLRKFSLYIKCRMPAMPGSFPNPRSLCLERGLQKRFIGASGEPERAVLKYGGCSQPTTGLLPQAPKHPPSFTNRGSQNVFSKSSPSVEFRVFGVMLAIPISRQDQPVAKRASRFEVTNLGNLRGSLHVECGGITLPITSVATYHL